MRKVKSSMSPPKKNKGRGNHGQFSNSEFCVILLVDMCRSVYSIMKGCSTFLSSLCVIGKQYRSTTTITIYKHRKRQIFVTSFRATARAHCSRFSARLFRSKKSAKNREPCARTILQKRRGNHGQFSNFDC